MARRITTREAFAWRRRWSMVAVGALLLAGCGGDDDATTEDGDSSDESSDAGDDEGLGAIAEALGGGGGGGTLTIDGEQIAVDAVTCVLDDETFDVGTVSDSGHRVFVTRSNPANDVSASFLDPDFVQWFPQGVSGDEAQRDGSSFSSDTKPYFNNADDRIVEVSFTIDCP